jgi:hypothetical protein
MIFLSKINTLAQYTCRLRRTEDINCNLPAKDKFLDNHESILAVILETKASQSHTASLLVIRGTPKYLTERSPSCILKKSSKSILALEEIPAQKRELLEGLSHNLDKFSNSSSTPLIALTESREAAEKINKSSAKHKCVS